MRRILWTICIISLFSAVGLAENLTIDKTSKQIFQKGIAPLTHNREIVVYNGNMPLLSSTMTICDFKFMDAYTLVYSSATNMERKRRVIKRKMQVLLKKLAVQYLKNNGLWPMAWGEE